MTIESTTNNLPQELLSKRQERGRRHVLGLCGGYAGLCYDCYREEKEYYLGVYKPQPEPGENIIDYWRRTNLPFVDCWYEVAYQTIKQAYGVEGVYQATR